LKMRPTRSALPWVPPLVPLNRHANAAAILRCQTRRSRADQSIHFVSAESSQPETHSRANKQLASGQIHDEARTIQSIPPPTKKNTQKTREKSGQLKPVRKRSSERPLMESPRRGVAAADPAGRAAPIHRQRTSFFFRRFCPVWICCFSERMRSWTRFLPLIFDGNGKVPEPKEISLISAPVKGIGVYIAGELSSSQRLPTVAVRKQVVACSQPWSGTFTMGTSNIIIFPNKALRGNVSLKLHQ
jgi:hypothetical protein